VIGSELPQRLNRPRPRPSLPARPLDWRKDILRPSVTICIGIASEATGRLYFATDSLVSNDWTQAEGVQKFYQITRGYQWVAMYEDNPATATTLLKSIEAQLSATPTEVQVQDACHHAFGRTLSVCPSRTQGQLDASLLVLGYDMGVNLSGPVKRCLFEFTNEGKVIDRISQGYAAIGSGKYAAEDVLNGVDFFNHTMDDDTIIYWLAAAKFAAEKSVTTVGWRNTVIVSVDQAAGWSTMCADDVKRLHAIWQRHMQKPPRRAITHIREAFLPMAKLQERATSLAKQRRQS
jgi:20S proteasome alpha/beta subunit